MISANLLLLVAGFWLAVSRERQNAWTSREMLASLTRETLHLIWQTALLAAVLTALARVPHAGSAAIGILMAAAYLLSLRPARSVFYFMALFLLAQYVSGSAWREIPWRLIHAAGVSLGFRLLLLGLQERLRWSQVPAALQGLPAALFCASLIAFVLWSMGL